MEKRKEICEKKKQSITQLAVVLKKKMKMKKWEHSKSMLPHDKPKTISPRPYTRLVQQRTLTETVSQEGKRQDCQKD